MAFFSTTRKDKYGMIKKDYYLTQGDTATFKIIPKRNNELIDFNLITKCVFKISDIDYKEIISKECKKDDGFLIVTFSSSETTILPVDKLIYEVEYTFVGDVVFTANESYIEIFNQIKE